MNLLHNGTTLIRRHAWYTRHGRGWYAQLALRLLLILAMVTPFGALSAPQARAWEPVNGDPPNGTPGPPSYPPPPPFNWPPPPTCPLPGSGGFGAGGGGGLGAGGVPRGGRSVPQPRPPQYAGGPADTGGGGSSGYTLYGQLQGSTGGGSAERPPMQARTAHPVNLYRGAVVEQVTDLSVPNAQFGWAFARTYDSQLRIAGTYNNVPTASGTRWLSSAGLPFIVQNGDDVELVVSASTKRVFEDSSLTPPPDYRATLEKTDAGADEKYTLTETDTRNVLVFYGFNGNIAAENRGRLDERTTLEFQAAGMDGDKYTYVGDEDAEMLPGFGFVSSITTAAPQEYSINFSYYSSGDEYGKLKSILVEDGSSKDLQKVEYIYRGNDDDYTDDLGHVGSLVQVKVSRRATGDTGANLSIVRYTQYRYHRSGDADGWPGQLKMVLEADAIERILADGISDGPDAGTEITPEDILYMDDTDVTSGTLAAAIGAFASRSFTYYKNGVFNTSSIDTPWADDEDLDTKYGGTNVTEILGGFSLVRTETINGACVSCGGAESGGVKHSYFYMDVHGTSTDADYVRRLVVEDTEDANGTAVSRTLYALNFPGVALRTAVIKDPTAGTLKAWCTSTTLDADERIAQERMPSAHTLIDSNSELALFLDPTGNSGANDTNTLNASAGVIYVYTYDISGDRVYDVRVKKGRTGDANYISATDFGDGDGDAEGADNDDENLVIATYVYPEANTSRTATSRITTTYAYEFWDDADTAVQIKKTTLPVIDDSTGDDQNGSNVATVLREYYDEEGRLRWTKDGEENVTYYSYNPDTGGLAYMMADVETDDLPDELQNGESGKWIAWEGGTTVPSDFANSDNDNLQLVTKYEFDELGRTVLTIEPDGAKHYTVYEANRTLRFPYWNGSTTLLPIQVTEFCECGSQLFAMYSVRAGYTSFTTSSGAPTGFDTEPSQENDYVSLTRYEYDPLHGQLSEVRRYHDLGDDDPFDNYYSTNYLYDAMGRRAATIQGVESGKHQVDVQIFDFLGRVGETRRGVATVVPEGNYDYDDLDNSPPGTPNNFDGYATVSTTVYDSGNVGDGHVTTTRGYFDTGTNDYIATTFYRTWRGHLYGIFRSNGGSGFMPYQAMGLDWLGRVTISASYTHASTWLALMVEDPYSDSISSADTGRNNLTKTHYDDLGRVYRTESYPGTEGTNHFETNNWYDRNGRPVASGQKYSAHQEYAYDGAGRQYQSRTVMDISQATPYSSGAFDYNEPAPNPSLAAMITAGDGDEGVIEMSHAAFDTAGNVIEQHEFEANHNDADGIDINATDSYVRRTVFMWYDAADRLTTMADYGSGDGDSTPSVWMYSGITSYPGSEPDWDDSAVYSGYILLTRYAYDAASGRQETVTIGVEEDSSDTVMTTTKTFYDDLGRVTFVAENHVDFVPPSIDIGGTTDDDDRVVKFAYNGLNQRTSITAYNGSGNPEETNYWFEDPYNASLNTHTAYPDSSSTPSGGSDLITVTYHLDGSPATRTDQRGTEITYTYNARRQVEFEKVSNVGGDTDDAVLSIKRTYDDLGRPLAVTSYDDEDGAGNVVNEVLHAYHATLGLLQYTYQSHEGAVNTGSSPKVAYQFDTDVDGDNIYVNGLRQKQVDYPVVSGAKVFSYFNTANSIDDRLHRARYQKLWGGALDSNNASTTWYQYNGTGRLVRLYTESDQTNVELKGYTGNDYDRYDRFGRVVKQMWESNTGSTLLDQVDYTYDYAGNRLTQDIPSSLYASNDKDQLYTYDGLHRLTDSEQGTWSGTAITSPNFEQVWTLDQLGNWPEFKQDSNGDGSFAGASDLDQDRQHNKVNEIDNNDNHGDAPSSTITAGAGQANWIDPVYDAAGNMTEGPSPLDPTVKQKYVYDGWNRLVAVTDGADDPIITNEYDGLGRRIVKDVTGGSTEDRDYYYNDQWQLLTEVKDGSAYAVYHWHPFYVDALAARMRASDTHYFLHDANYNVTAAVDDSDNTVVERYAYTAYGEVTILDDDFSEDADQQSDIGNTHLYTGRERDFETGLQLNRNRFYSAHLGRWLNRDPIGYAGGSHNIYAYVRGGPTYASDPYGLRDPDADKPWPQGCGRPRSPYPKDYDAWYKACVEPKLPKPCGGRPLIPIWKKKNFPTPEACKSDCVWGIESGGGATTTACTAGGAAAGAALGCSAGPVGGAVGGGIGAVAGYLLCESFCIEWCDRMVCP